VVIDSRILEVDCTASAVQCSTVCVSAVQCSTVLSVSTLLYCVSIALNCTMSVIMVLYSDSAVQDSTVTVLY